MKHLSSGNIVQVYLRSIDRYICLKYIDVRDLTKEVSYPFQFRVHGNIKQNNKITNDELDFSDLLFSPLHLTGFNSLIKQGTWKILGTQDINEYDKSQHHYKMAWPPNLLAMFDEVKAWRVVKDINNVNEGILVPYSQCSHLEYAENLGVNHLEFRVMIEFYKMNGGKLSIDKTNWTKFDHVLFSRYINMPVYRFLPNEQKGKLLSESVESGS